MQNKIRRYTAPEIVAIHLSWDIADVRDARYKPGHFKTDVYSIGDHYFSAPTAAYKLPKEWNWHEVGEYHGRKVFCAHMVTDAVED